MDLQGQVLAGPEGPADAGEVEAHLLGAQAQAGDDLAVVHVHPLGGDVEVHPALAVGHGQARLGAQHRLVLDPDLVVALDHHLAPEALVAVDYLEGAEGLAAARRLLGVGEGVERLVGDHDGGGGPAGGLPVVGGHHAHRLAPEAHLAVGQNGLVLVLLPEAGIARDVGGDQGGVHPGDGQRRADVHRDDAGPGVGAAHRGPPQHAVVAQVRGVGELALELGDAVGAGDRGAHPACDLDGGVQAGGHGVSSPGRLPGRPGRARWPRSRCSGTGSRRAPRAPRWGWAGGWPPAGGRRSSRCPGCRSRTAPPRGRAGPAAPGGGCRPARPGPRR